ncbi:matrixin family metalloprotease [Peribacillus sp. V2I11]|uniref:matrixin family metalloprotease n=1 Tax=Peribacillus sp. V2I11 TaxID=3042277 RepID=UPI002785FFD7|nr:matrixin family metalloprotease [Peribacillus sp. V2I11]MDQ0884896.1 putative Zn-dependent protease [Peribacillus sp. V2I11]
MRVPSSIGLKRNSKGKPVKELQKFLGKFGYLDKTTRVAELEVEANFDENIETALKKYQEFHNLPITGELDEATVKQMKVPRCGFPDLNQGTAKSNQGTAKFTTQGNRWDKNNLTYRFVNFTSDLTEGEVRSGIATAFGLWSEVTPLTFTEVTSGNADILISFVTGDHGDGDPFDGAGNVLAHAYYPPQNGGEIAGDAHFDDDETWSMNLPPSGFDLISVAAHEFGHSLGLAHSTVSGSLMFPSYSGPQRALHEDDIAGIQSIYGHKFPNWQELDNNSASVDIVADGNNLYQLHNNGGIWKYTGTPLTGWQELDNNTATKKIVAVGGNLYQFHNNGRIWKYTGTPFTGWLELDNNPASVDIVAGGNDLYQLHNNGRIWKYTGTPFTGWVELDNNTATKNIVAAGGNLYQIHNNGHIWKYTGTPLTGWQELDNNPASLEIEADSNDLYQLHSNGRIWKYTGTPLTGWQELDNNPATKNIVAAGGNLYQIHSNGRIWKYTGTPLTGWQELDNNPATKNIVAAGGNLYQIHNNGRIWKYTLPL